jgi:4'-phosphopantetheinyl transferase
LPPLPPAGQPVLIRVATAQLRQVARQELRNTLRQVLAKWSDFLPEQLPLHETSRGPVWSGQIGGHTLDISLSYAEREGWIGLMRAGLIGVDAMQIQPIAEAESVARHYLGGAVLATIQQSYNPALAFAKVWTEWEAKIKCLKQELNEWSDAQAITLAKCATQSMVFHDHQIVTMATDFSS